MRKSLVFLIAAALMLAACGPAMQPSTSMKTESGQTFMMAFPRLEIEFDKDGKPMMLGMKLEEAGRLIGQDLSGIGLDKSIVEWMTNADVQHVEMRQVGHGLALLVNGKPMPHIGWDEKSLNQAMDLGTALAPQNESLYNVVRKLFPIVRRLGLAVVLRFPLKPGATAIPLADPAVAMAPPAPVKDVASVIAQFEIRYDAQGVPSILDISGYDLASLGLPLPVKLEDALLKNLQAKNIQHIEIRTKPDGMFVYVNGNPLPNLVWDRALLKNAVEVYSRLSPESPFTDLLTQLAPTLDTVDLGVLVHFPLAPGVTPIPAQLH